MEKKVYELNIDEDLEKVAPPLADFELCMLKEDILEHGCKCPLIVWGDTVIDGHNRYRICQEHGIPFAIEQMEFSDKTSAKLWIVKNQLGRRNLKDFQRCEMVLPLEDEFKAEAEERRRAALSALHSGDRTVQTFAPSKKTRSVLADMAGVSYATLDKVKRIVVSADEDTLEKLRSGEMKIHTAFVQICRKKDPGHRHKEKKDMSVPAGQQGPGELLSGSRVPDAGQHESGELLSVCGAPDAGQHGSDGSFSVNGDKSKPEEKTEYIPEMTEEEDEPSGFEEIKEQMDYAFRTFQEDFKYALDWFSTETATKENQEKVMGMIDDLMSGIKAAVINKMEELR